MNKHDRQERHRALQQELEQLDEEEARLHTEFLEAEAALESRRRITHIQQSYLSPIYTLPNDILAYIFEDLCAHDCRACFKAAWNWRFGIDLPRPLSPWTLSHVCQRFRALASSLPRLWCCLHTKEASIIPAAVEHYIQKTRDVPLCIIFDRVYEHSKDTELVSFRLAWDVLRAEKHRWKYLAIGAYGDTARRDMMFSKKLNLPMMQGLYIQNPSGPAFYDESSAIAERNIVMPRLSSLCSNNVTSYIGTGSLANLTTLKIRSQPRRFGGQEWLSVLNEVPNLEHFSVDNFFPISDPSYTPPSEPPVLPRLRYLEIIQFGGKGLGFPAISTPSLQSLDIKGGYPRGIMALLTTKTDTLPQVQHLVMDGLHLDETEPEELERAISLLPNVISADFNLSNEAMVAVASNGALLPRLETLSVQYGPGDHLGGLKRFVKARITAGHPLKKLKVNPYDDYPWGETPHRAFRGVLPIETCDTYRDAFDDALL